MNQKAQERITKDLDLQQYMRRQRWNTFALFSLLSIRQKALLDSLSRLIISNRSDSDELKQESSESSNDGEENFRARLV